MGEMTQRDDIEPRGSDNESRGDFMPSEAAMEEFYASRRRYIRPVLVFLPVMFITLAIRKYEVAALMLIGVGLIVTLFMVAQNGVLAMRADRRLRAEKREWKAKQARPS
jgi:Na+/H+ antiporter NhaC